MNSSTPLGYIRYAELSLSRPVPTLRQIELTLLSLILTHSNLQTIVKSAYTITSDQLVRKGKPWSFLALSIRVLRTSLFSFLALLMWVLRTSWLVEGTIKDCSIDLWGIPVLIIGLRFIWKYYILVLRLPLRNILA